MDHVFRTREIEEASNRYFIHPISRQLVGHFARWGLHPNTVSAFGMLSAVLAAVSFYHYRHIGAVVIGAIFLIAWHVFDGADGQLARLTQQTSELGKIIDGLCDHLGIACVYIALTLSLAAEFGNWVWLLAIAAGVSHVVQAGAFEYQRDMYDCWVHDRKHKCVPTVEQLRQEAGRDAGPVDRLYLIYVALQHRFAAVDDGLIELRRRLLADAQACTAVASDYREINQSSVLRWSWLSANKRSLAIVCLCALQIPMAFFLLELVALNALLLWLIHQQRRRNQRLARALTRRLL